MESNLNIIQGANNGWFIYQDNRLLLGSHDKDLIERVRMFLENDGKCNHTELKRIGETKLWCCNICGNRTEDF